MCAVPGRSTRSLEGMRTCLKREARHWLIFVGAFATVLIGGGLAYVADQLSWRWLSWIAVAIAATGMIAGFVCLAWRLITLPRAMAEDFRALGRWYRSRRDAEAVRK